MAIITTANYKTYRGIAGTGYDAQLNVVIPAVEAAAIRAANRDHFEATSTIEFYDGEGGPTLIARNAPIIEITSIQILNSDGTTASTFASTDYAFDTDLSGRIYFRNSTYGRVVRDDWGVSHDNDFRHSPRFPGGRGNIRLQYASGYETVPADLQLAMYEAVDLTFEKVRDGGKGVGPFQSETLGRYTYTKLSTPEARVKLMALFAPWRRVAFV